MSEKSGQRSQRKSLKKVRPFQRNKVGEKGRREVSFGKGQPDDLDSDDLEIPSNNFLSPKQLQLKAQELFQIRKSLPVYQNRDEIMKYVSANQVTILIGETGSGKSTQIPQFLLEDLTKHDKGRPRGIAVTQPRRVAALNLATRVAQEHGCNVGTEVGYSVRFDNCTSKRTVLKYLTDGMLLRELMMHKDLNEYGVVINDEAH